MPIEIIELYLAFSRKAVISQGTSFHNHYDVYIFERNGFLLPIRLLPNYWSHCNLVQ